MGKEKALEFKANVGILTAESYVQYLKDTPAKARSVIGLRHSLVRACRDATGLLQPKTHGEKLTKAVEELPVGNEKPAWFDFKALPRTDADKPAVAGKATASTEEELKPKVISFDPKTQLPTNQQDCRGATATSLGSFPLPINEWRCSAAAKELGQEPALAGAVLSCLWARHMSAVAEAKVEVLQDASTAKRTVQATAAHEAQSIELWPCAPKASKLLSTSAHPERVPVQVYVKGGPEAPSTKTFYLLPEFKPPADKTPAEVADHDVRLRTWKWDAQETMHLFWAANRVTQQELHQRNERIGSAVARINMELQDKELAVCVPGPSGIVLAVGLKK